MAEFTVTTFINRPPNEVFDFVSDPANGSKWQSSTQSSEWTSDGPVGVGSTVRSISRMLGRDMEMDLEVTEWVPPKLWGQKGNSGPMKFVNTNKFESKDGGTLLVQNFQGEVGGFFKVAESLAIKQLQKMVETDGKALKMLLEASS
jgi:uncharacterized protein YndB with AHSA1/START domain